MTAIANAGGGSTIDANTQLAVASVTCTEDISGRDLIATRELHVDGATVLNSSLTVDGTNVMSAIADKQNAITGATSLSLSAVTTSGAIRSNGGGSDGCGSVSIQGNGAELTWYHLNTFRWSLFCNPVQTRLQLYSGGKGLTVDIHYTTGFVIFLGGSGTASDASLKTVPQDANTEDCLQMLRSVSARTHERIDLEPGKSRIGFIAQEVQNAAPRAFGGLLDTCLYSSQRGEAERVILTLDYGRLSTVLWQCTHSLLARVEALEARLA